MRIVVNNIAASSGGAMTVLKDFYTCVCKNEHENEWIFLLSDKYFEETENVKIIALPEIKKNPIKKVLFDFFTGRKLINSLNPDVVFSMQNILTFGVKAPQTVYVHQSLPFQEVKKFSFFKKTERALAFKQYVVGAIIKKSIKKANKVIVQTEWMRDGVIKKCKSAKEKIVKILPNVKEFDNINITTDFNNTHFFYPSSNTLYKNNTVIFKASEILDEWRIEHSIELTLPKEKSKGNIKCTDRLPYEEVINKYASSTLVFPSYLETFGYPLAEARKLGAIVLASDTPFSRELLKDYKNAYFFNPFDATQLANLMKQVVCKDIVKLETNEKSESIVDSWELIIEQITKQ